MRKPWPFLPSFALLGLLIAYASYACEAFHDYSKPETEFHLASGVISVILCPPELILMACIDCETPTGRDGFATYSMIGLLNAALYALIGAIIVSFRSRYCGPSGPGDLGDLGGGDAATGTDSKSV